MAFPQFLKFSKISSLAVGLALTAVAVGTNAYAESENSSALHVVIDRAKVVRVAKAADTIIIGNPSIVDATIQDARTIVLTGRNFGVTNLIVLDSDGDPIVDETIIVRGHETNIVRVYRQSVRETLSCSPVCENTLTIGDNQKQFEAIHGQIESRNKLAESGVKN